MASTQEKNATEAVGWLPDPTRRAGPYRAFDTDPGWREALWWLGVPALLAAGLIAINALAHDFYTTWVLPEGYGFLELGQLSIASAGLLLALRLIFRPFVKQKKLLFAFSIFAAFCCLYIAGEEHSWGQHFFHWNTPDYWVAINRQQETNLHNTMDLFDKKPRVLLELGVLIGGFVIPACAFFHTKIRRMRWSLFFPADAMVPVALGAILFKTSDSLQDIFGIRALVGRPSESIEFYLYLFIFFYLIIFSRRIGELEREAIA